MLKRIPALFVAVACLLALNGAFFSVPAAMSAADPNGRITSTPPSPGGIPATGLSVDKPAGLATSPQANNLPEAPINFVIDDGSAERAIGFGSSSSNRTGAGIWLNRFTPGSVYYPLRLDSIQMMFPGPNAGNFVGRQIVLVVYVDTDSNNNPDNATLVYQSLRTIQYADWMTWNVYPVDVNITLHGDIYIGWEDRWAESGPSPIQYIGTQDTNAPQQRSWFSGPQYLGQAPSITNLGSNYYLGRVEVLFGSGFAGNWMVRASGSSTDPATPTPVPPRCPGEQFTDVCPGDYFYTAVNSLANAGVISGYNTVPPCESAAHVPCFKPYNSITRAQSAKIIVLGAGLPINTTGGPHFIDVPPGNTFYNYIETAYNAGVISGYADGTFRPNNYVTRGQFAKMVVLAFGLTINTSGGPHFSDVPPGSAFYTYVETAYNSALISGYADGTFRPGNNITRGQAAKIVYGARLMPTPTPTATAVATVTPTLTATPMATETATPTTTPVR